jgi:hypothetical protein
MLHQFEVTLRRQGWSVNRQAGANEEPFDALYISDLQPTQAS